MEWEVRLRLSPSEGVMVKGEKVRMESEKLEEMG
jgi:hypothetical protein